MGTLNFAPPANKGIRENAKTFSVLQRSDDGCRAACLRVSRTPTTVLSLSGFPADALTDALM
jgi:hypothetical protein